MSTLSLPLQFTTTLDIRFPQYRNILDGGGDLILLTIDDVVNIYRGSVFYVL